MILAEELEFRRTGSYRSSTFEEVSRRVYFDTSVMGLYMDGLLLSQVLWGNHISILDSYVREYLPRCPAGMRHLEVGPGHGLLLFLASRIDGARLTGWDVSSASIERTRTALARLGASGVTLARRSVTDPPGPSDPAFDSVVISEVLEHLEHPDQALLGLRSQMSPGARIFVNAPVNSPTVDHIHLFRAPEEIVDLVVSCGFEVEATRFAPSTGYTEARARQLGSTISCAVIARKVT